MAAIQAASFAHRSLGGTTGAFAWPWQGLPIAAAVIVYCVVTSASAEIVVPLFAKQPINRSWLQSMLRGCASYFIGAGVAVGLVEVIEHRVWEILPVAAVPLYFAYRAYAAHVNRLEEEHRRREVIESLQQGMSVIDAHGTVMLWNDVLERILDCPRERAMGRSLVDAAPVLAKSELPRAINEAWTQRAPRTVDHLRLSSAAGARILRVEILPVSDGVTLLWHDVTERTQAEELLSGAKSGWRWPRTARTTGCGNGTCGARSSTRPAAGAP